MKGQRWIGLNINQSYFSRFIIAMEKTLSCQWSYKRMIKAKSPIISTNTETLQGRELPCLKYRTVPSIIYVDLHRRQSVYCCIWFTAMGFHQKWGFHDSLKFKTWKVPSRMMSRRAFRLQLTSNFCINYTPHLCFNQRNACIQIYLMTRLNGWFWMCFCKGTLNFSDCKKSNGKIRNRVLLKCYKVLCF